MLHFGDSLFHRVCNFVFDYSLPRLVALSFIEFDFCDLRLFKEIPGMSTSGEHSNVPPVDLINDLFFEK